MRCYSQLVYINDKMCTVQKGIGLKESRFYTMRILINLVGKQQVTFSSNEFARTRLVAANQSWSDESKTKKKRKKCAWFFNFAFNDSLNRSFIAYAHCSCSFGRHLSCIFFFLVLECRSAICLSVWMYFFIVFFFLSPLIFIFSIENKKKIAIDANSQ